MLKETCWRNGLFCMLCMTVWAIHGLAQTGPSGTPVLQLNLKFTEGSGALANDTSGHGNNCTLQTATGRTPTWTTAGLRFARGQGCDLPATANNIQSWCFSFNIPPVPAAFLPNAGTMGLLFSNLGDGFNGYSLLTAYAGSQSERVLPDTYAPTIYSASEQPQTPNYYDYATASNTTMVATNRVCYVLGQPGVSVDHLYLNGVETPYGVQGATFGQQTGSFLSMGSANVPQWASAGGPQTIYHALGFTGALTPAEVTSVDQFLVSDLQQRGVATAPVSTISPVSMT